MSKVKSLMSDNCPTSELCRYNFKLFFFLVQTHHKLSRYIQLLYKDEFKNVLDNFLDEY